MIKFKLNGHKIDIPSSWEDLTFDQYCEINKKDADILKLVLSSSGMDYEVIKNATFTGLEDVIIALSFVKKPPVIPPYVSRIGNYDLPATKDGKYYIPLESLAQFEDMKAILKKHKTENFGELMELFPKIIAIYLQKIRDGEYSYVKAQEMVEEVRKMKAVEVISLGSFFIIKLSNLITGTPDSSHHTKQSQKKSKQATTSSRKLSAATAQSRKRR